MAPVEIVLLGAVHGPKLPTRKAWALLAYLAMSPGQLHRRGKLATLLWSDAPDDRALASLRYALAAIRRSLPHDSPAILRSSDGVGLNPAAVRSDAVEFERLAREGTPEALAAAAALYRGDLLEGLAIDQPPFEEWLRAERERLRELALEVLAALVAHHTRTGDTARAIQAALRLVALDPLQEVAHRALMRLYASAGRRGAALRQYQFCVDVVQRELGAEPEPETQRLYRSILAAPSTARRAPDVFGSAAPLIGRDGEAVRLRQALADAAAGHGRIVVVSGEAGIGKSRLLDTLGADVRERAARLLVGRCHETERALAFGPWVDALRTARVGSQDPAVDHVPAASRAELTRLLPELARPDLPPATRDARRLFQAVFELVAEVAASGPLVIVLEDAHWADDSSLRLAAFVARRIAALPVLVVLTVRDDETPASPALAGVLDELLREPDAIHLALSPLSRTDTTAMLRSLLGPAREPKMAVADHVWHVSEGNPFVVVEMARALRDGAVLPGDQGVPLPERVRRLIEVRLGRLGERARHLVAVAAVIGREFEFPLLARTAGMPDAEAAEALEELVRRRVVHGVGERFDFVHERIRNVAYASLLPPRRTLLHAAAAMALEERHAENLASHYMALGTHCREAGMWAKAVIYLRRAGAQAVERTANREAAACFTEALAALARLPETRAACEEAIDLRLELRNVLFPLGENARMQRCLGEAEALAARLGDHQRLGWISTYVSNSFWRAGDHARALEAGRRALALGEKLDDVRLTAAANLRLGQVYDALGEYRHAVAALRRTLALLDDLPAGERFGLAGLPAVFAGAFLVKSLTELGEFADGLAVADRAVSLARSANQPFSMAIADFTLGYLHVRRGDVQEAIAILERGRALCQASDMPVVSIQVDATLGYAYVLAGRVREGLELLEAAAEQATALQFMYFHALTLAWLAEARLVAGRPDDAARLAERALTLARAQHGRGDEAWSLRLLADIAARAQPPRVEEGETAYRRALTLAEDLGMRPLAAQVRDGLARLDETAGPAAAGAVRPGASPSGHSRRRHDRQRRGW
ncbi:MAG TPA: AAA family ATPase [Candidatus Tectomicrobia bacterium]|nr:AAA family ATPase [Candidatus Tectomicrobia bacterium]